MNPAPRLPLGPFLVALATILLGFQLAPGARTPGVIEGADAGMTASDEKGGAAPALDLERRVQALERQEAEARRERAALREEISALRQRLETLHQALQEEAGPAEPSPFVASGGGYRMEAGGSVLEVTPSGITLSSAGGLTLQAGAQGATLSSQGIVSLQGLLIHLNGDSRPVARVQDPVSIAGTGGAIVQGSTTVRAGG